MSLMISVVTATFNSSGTVGQTIKSVKDQTYRNIEHVVVDGGSTDDTLDLVAGNMRDGTIINSQRDEGIYDALNRGVSLSTGDVVGFLHSDDFYYDDFVVQSIAEAFKDPAVDMCYGDLIYVSKNDTKKVVRRWRAGGFAKSRLKFGWMPPHPSLYVRRELLLKYPFDVRFSVSGDYDQMIRMLCTRDQEILYLPTIFVAMRTGGASNRSVRNIFRKSFEDYKVIRKHSIGGLGTVLAKNIRKIPQLFSA
jgi:glycosyltransferase